MLVFLGVVCWSYFGVVLLSGGGVIFGWSFVGVVFFLKCSYFWGGLISAVVLFLGWSYFWVVDLRQSFTVLYIYIDVCSLHVNMPAM